MTRTALSACMLVGTLVSAAGSASGQAGVVFTDVTSAVGINMINAPKPLGVPNSNEWMMAGACVIDANRDGWPDIFVLKGGNGTDRLYINNRNGTFSDQSVAWGVSLTHCGDGTAVGDFDRDGWPDIYVTSYGNSNNNQGEIGKNRLYRNNGNGTFSEVAVAAGVNVTSSIASSGDGAAWGDYDLDGDLDLAVCAWSSSAKGNRLFRNNGNGTFTDVTGVAIQIPTVTWGFQPNFADIDGDGYPDLLLAADFGTTRAFHNNRDGTFAEVTSAWGANLVAFGMGQCVADFNRDGKLDWYVTSIYQDVPANPLIHNGNVMLMSPSTPPVIEVSQAAGTDDGGWGWGAVALDADNDGWVDIVEANGRNSLEWANEPEYFYGNLGGGTFVRDDAVSSAFLAADGRTVLTFDYDHDGDLDVVIYYNLGPLKVYRNDSARQGSWLELTFDAGTNPFVAPLGYGVRAVAKVGEVEHTRYLDGGNGYLGSSELMLHFGLGSARSIDELRITWPRGRVQVIPNVAVNQRLHIVAPTLADLNADGHVDAADLAILLGAWGPVTASSLHIDLDNNGFVDAGDLAVMLGGWTN